MAKNKFEQAATEATKGFFSVNNAEGVQTANKADAGTKTTRSKGKDTEAAKTPSEAVTGASVIFSVRADSERVAEWRAYAKAKKDVSLSEVVADAMREYIKRHALTEAEADTYSREMRKHDILKNL